MKFWWVNHNQTARHEVDGGYLWSPKRETSGARSEFYNNMRKASPGDIVLSYSGQSVRYVGKVTDYAFTALKPQEFGLAGSYWAADGWLLPVSWNQILNPVRPKQIIEQLRPILPHKYSPISPITGNGNQKAYLAEISQEIVSLILPENALPSVVNSNGNDTGSDVLREIMEDKIEMGLAVDRTLDETVRRAVIQARRGQGAFRENVQRIENSCRLTGVNNPSLLIASHIKPWRVCGSAEERLDGLNGFLLTPDADLLFDRGFISFGPDGNVKVSSRIDSGDLTRLGLGHLNFPVMGLQDSGAVWQEHNSMAAHERYLAYHRENVFLG